MRARQRKRRAGGDLFVRKTMETLYQRTAALVWTLKNRRKRVNHYPAIKLADVDARELAHLVRQEVERNATRLVVLDSVNGYLMSTPA
jgi:hypothetical protein